MVRLGADRRPGAAGLRDAAEGGLRADYRREGGARARAGAGGPRGAGAAYEEAFRLSSLAVDNSRIVTTDRYISGVLETGVNSQLASGGEASAGDLVIQVGRDVFGYHGRNILIPKGSRLVCGFRAPKQGESRLGVSCGRVLLGGSRAEIYEAGGGGFDVQGRRGRERKGERG